MEQPAGTQEQEMGVLRRIVGALFSPGRTFASVSGQVAHKDWLLPMIIVAVVGALSAYLIMPVLQTEVPEALREQLRKNETLSEEQRARALENAQKVGGITAIAGAPFVTAAKLFIQAAIFLALTNFILSGSGTYKKTLSVVSYSALVDLPAAIVTVPLALAKGSAKVQVGLGLPLSRSMEGSYLFNFLSMINLFSIWQFALIAIGLGIIAGIQTKRAAYGVFGLWIVYILVAAAFQSLLGK